MNESKIKISFLNFGASKIIHPYLKNVICPNDEMTFIGVFCSSIQGVIKNINFLPLVFKTMLTEKLTVNQN